MIVPTDVIAIISGGMDSAVMLYHLVKHDNRVTALSFDYGQRHRKELSSARLLADFCGVEHIIYKVDLPADSALQGTCEVPDGHYAEESMKATVVPSRNLVFIALASGLAVARKATAVAFAAHGGDHTIYPDCRPEFVSAVAHAVRLANWQCVNVVAPFVDLTKKDIVLLGSRLKVPFEVTWSCYKGGEQHCGTCGTCVERKEAFKLARVTDPTEYLS